MQYRGGFDLGRKIHVLFIWLLVSLFSNACGLSRTEPDARTNVDTADMIGDQTVDASALTLAPLATPVPTPVVPPDFKGVEELIPLFNYDQDADLDIDQSLDSVQIQSISYISPLGGRVTGYMVIPMGKGPFAGLLYMHGAQGSRSSFLGEAVRMAEMGAVSLLIDGLPSRPEPWRQASATGDLTQYRSLQIQTIIDLRRGVDVLISYPEVDANRLGFVGHSYGAILGGVLSGVEHRIKAYVLMAGYPRFSHAIQPELQTEEFIITMNPIDPIHYVGNATPSALFFQYGFDDENIPPDLALDYADAASEPKRVKFYQTGHMLDFQAFLDRAEWLASQLRLNMGQP
jgi:dienelactone hydrolase